MKITSTAFSDKELMPLEYTCDGQDVNPPLMIEDVPLNAKSMVLIMDDPDAPGGNFNHWLVWNIDPNLKEIKPGFLPAEAVVGVNEAGIREYTGPCPPSGLHHYYFRIFALDKILNIDPNSKRADVRAAIEGHILESAELVALYQR